MVWNKGLGKELQPRYRKRHTDETKKKMSDIAKGNTHGFKKGYTPWNKGKKCPSLSHQKNLGKKCSEETKRKLSEKARGRKFPPSFGLKISVARMGMKSPKKGKTYEEQFGEEKAKDIKEKIKKARAKQIIPKINSLIEVKIQNFLKQLGIEFFTHFYIRDIKHRYRCDIFIPSKKLVIECDGNYWHGNPKKFKKEELTRRIINQRRLDNIRVEELIKKGYKVLRLWEDDIKSMELNDFREILQCQI